MPTRGRPVMAREAVEAWKQQTYAPGELLILDDLDAPSFPEGYSGDGVRYWRIERKTIAQKRNILCEYARGEVIVHWDDDDVSAPGRITDQVERLLGHGTPVTGYHSMRFLDVASGAWYRYSGSLYYAVGTSLCFRRWYWERNRFEEVHEGKQVIISEDNIFVARASRYIVSVDAGEMMYARIHGAHSSEKTIIRADGTFCDNWRPA